MTHLLLSTLLVSGSQNSISSYLPSNLKDVSFNITIVRSSPKELTKIDDDYRKQYSFNNASVQLKDPFKVRINGSLDDTNFTMVINGSTKLFRVSALRINQRTNLSKSPGQRQTWLDFGAMTASVAEDFFETSFVRTDRETGAAVFDLRYPEATGDKTRMRVWIDKAHKFIARREWYGREGQLKGYFVFSNPTTDGGTSFPTQLTAYTADGKVAGEMRYVKVKLNSGLSEDLFKL